jgi:TATA-box binding protein (TBP) (component of TFIID and TFIIIB)
MSHFDDDASSVVSHFDVDAFASELDDTLRRINIKRYSDMVCTPASVTAMTITAKLNVKAVCRDTVAIALSMVEGDGPLSSTKTKKVETRSRRKRAGSGAFYNQFTMYYGSKSVKVFRNGSVHVTGCQSPREFVRVTKAVCNLIQDIGGIEPEEGGRLTVSDVAVRMINMNFGIDRRLHLRALCDVCVAAGFTARYDADVYPGLNVKLPIGGRVITVLLFKSGKVIITGARTAQELECAHAMITSLVAGEDTSQK